MAKLLAEVSFTECRENKTERTISQIEGKGINLAWDQEKWLYGWCKGGCW